jgi:hypothetical protein
MQPFKPGAVAQPHPGLAEPAREAVTVGQANVLVLEPAQERAQTIEVGRVALVGFACALRSRHRPRRPAGPSPAPGHR